MKRGNNVGKLIHFICIYVHSRKQKLAALYIQIARQALQLSSEFYDFFVALYVLFLPSHIYTECPLIIHPIISLNIAFSFTVVIVPLVDGLRNKEKMS
jgi:hypothetical protein